MEIVISFLVLGILGAILALGLVFASTKLYVEEDTRVVEVTSLLPGYNCGACGYPGCGGFAEGIIEKDVDKLGLCKPGKSEQFDKIMDFLKNDPDFKNLKK